MRDEDTVRQAFEAQASSADESRELCDIFGLDSGGRHEARASRVAEHGGSGSRSASVSSREKGGSGASRSNGRIDLQGARAPEIDLGATPTSLQID